MNPLFDKELKQANADKEKHIRLHLYSLNRASAERIMKATLVDGHLMTGSLDTRVLYWSPSSPNSGQIFLVLDAMEKLGWSWRLTEDCFYVINNEYDISIKDYTDKSKRNQIIIEACLEALERKSDE